MDRGGARIVPGSTHLDDAPQVWGTTHHGPQQRVVGREGLFDPNQSTCTPHVTASQSDTKAQGARTQCRRELQGIADQQTPT